MRSGRCPKCGTPTVYLKRNGIGYGSGDSLYVRTSWATRASEVEHYICSRCGYFEAYILDEQKMVDVVNNWEKVTPP